MQRIGTVEHAMQDMASKMGGCVSRITKMMQTAATNDTNTEAEIATKFIQLEQGWAKSLVGSSTTLSAQIRTLQDKAQGELEALRAHVGSANHRISNRNEKDKQC